MRCGCPECGAYMVHSESLTLGCICPECGRRCTDCLGTNTVISREALQQLKGTNWFTPSDLAPAEPADELPRPAPDDYVD